MLRRSQGENAAQEQCRLPRKKQRVGQRDPERSGRDASAPWLRSAPDLSACKCVRSTGGASRLRRQGGPCTGKRRSVGRLNVRSKSLGPKTAKNTKRACLLEPSRGARYPPAVGRVRGPRVGCMSCIGCAVVGSCCVGWVGIERSRSRAQLERGRSERSRSRARAGSESSGVGVERRARSSSSVERGRSRALSEGESGRRKRSASSVARDRRRTSRALGVERRARWESSEERDKSRAAREMGVERRKTRVERFERSPISCISGTRSESSVERARR